MLCVLGLMTGKSKPINMDFLVLKALHIIFVVTWFAGLFYIFRLFIYHVEAETKPDEARVILQSQYKLMSRRLWYIISWPSAIITLILASFLLITNPGYLKMPWMHVKLSLVLLLYVYHFYCHCIFKQLQNDIIKFSSAKLRMINEIATLFLFAIVFIVVLKNTLNWIYALIGLLALGIILFSLIKLYKNYRKQKEE